MTKLYRNPDYVRNLSEMELARDLYQGKKEVLVNNDAIFWKTATERSTDGEALLRDRRIRTCYQNFTEIVTSLIVSFLLRKAPDTTEAAKLLSESELKNIDGYGNSLQAFVKNKFTPDYLNYGKACILVEASKNSAKNRLEELASGWRPYFTYLNPISVTDWERESEQPRAGEFKFIRYEFIKLEPRNSEAEEPKEFKYSKAYSYQDGVIYSKIYRGAEIVKGASTVITDSENWNLLSNDPLGIKAIPLIVLEDESWLKDVNQESLRYFNIRSSKDNILHNQGYQRVFISGMDGQDTSAVQTLNESNWILLPTNSTVSTISPADVAGHDKALEESVNNIFKIGLNQLRLLPSDSRVAQGADSVAEEKENTFALIESTLEDIENSINRALSVYAEYKGETLEKGIELNKSISKTDVQSFVTIYNAFRDDFKKLGSLQKATLKKAVNFLGLDEEEIASISKEIDNSPIVEQTAPAQNDVLSRVLNANTQRNNRGSGQA
jgi:cell fate (sporulation/competence/biofilm development) regulator YmcA (YheA/YmcA/DUF963 family)